jgi:N-acetylmuramoyl-L-alanine amidase
VDEMKRVILIPVFIVGLVLCSLVVLPYSNINVLFKRNMNFEQMSKVPQKNAMTSTTNQDSQNMNSKKDNPNNLENSTPSISPSEQSKLQNIDSILFNSMKSSDTWVVTNSVVNVHSSPDLDAPIVLEAPNQSWFPLLTHSGKWMQIQLGNNQTGWVADWMVQTKNTDEQLQIINTKTDMLMYDGPDQDFLSNGTAHLNTPLIPLEVKGTWVHILSEQTGETGWIPSASALWKSEQNHLISASAKLADLPLNGKTIVVDPGHGGSDIGATGTGKKIYERDINLAVAEVLAVKLRAGGAHVVLTRTSNDQYVSLADRVKISNDTHADAFISIHQNQYQKDPSVSGAITYYFNSTPSKTLARDIEDQSLAALHSQEWKDQINQDELYVLDHNTRPAVLIEGCFLSNAKELANSITPDYQENLASGIYHGVLEYFGKYTGEGK